MKKGNVLKPVGFLFVITAIVAVINFAYNVTLDPNFIRIPDTILTSEAKKR